MYVGKSSKSLRIRDYKQHFTGTAGNSTIRKSLGCLLGFKLIPRDINSPQNGKTTFGEFDERTLTEWMKDNLLLFYYANNDYANVEKELIRIYNPPLNLQGNVKDFGLSISSRIKTFVFKYISVAAKWIRTSRTYVLNIYTENPAYKIAFQQDFG